jgi:hypothetical protein
MKYAGRLGIVLVLLTSIGGCARQLPLISHAHIGHTLTAWRGTPDEQGLFVVAEREAAIALQEAQLAACTTDPEAARQHASNVVHALNPDLETSGPGLDYGAIRALQGSMDHIKFAATTQDASHHVIRSADAYARSADRVLGCFQVALGVAQLAAQASDAETRGLSEELEALLRECVSGGKEAGLVQLRQQLSAMASQETDPPYHPLGRRYLLGLIRLPNGEWVYQFDQTNPVDTY